MNPKVEKLREEREKNREKIEKLTARNRVIDETVRNLENTDIIGLVREQGLSPDMLAELLASMKAARRHPCRHAVHDGIFCDRLCQRR